MAAHQVHHPMALHPCCHAPPAEGWAARLRQPADLACILLGSLAHCLDNGAALRCFAELR